MKPARLVTTSSRRNGCPAVEEACRIEERLQADRCKLSEPDQHRLAAGGAEGLQSGGANHLAAVRVGHDQAVLLGQERTREIACDCKIEQIAIANIFPPLAVRDESERQDLISTMLIRPA
jgi:hypothetical protein